MSRIEIRAKKPKKGLARDLVDHASSQIAKGVAELLRTQSKRTVQSWENVPQINVKRSSRGDEIVIKMLMERWAVPIWERLDKGTSPHTITPKNARFLVFRQTGFVSKTRPNTFSSRKGQEATGELQFRKQVNHPGHEPRNWTRMMEERAMKKLRDEIKQAQKNMGKNKK